MGKAKVAEELNLINILQTISKLRAVTNVLVDNRPELINKIELKYFEYNTIKIDGKQTVDDQNVFESFMTCDMRRKLK